MLTRCNTVIRGRNTIDNYVRVYNQVRIEGGRPGDHIGSVTCAEPDRLGIGDDCWTNHGATMHGSQTADGIVL